MLITGEAPAAFTARPDGIFDARRVFEGLPGRTREDVLEELALRLAREGAVREPGELVTRLIEREKLGCTGLGGGVAIPHCKLRDLAQVVVAVASTERPIDFGASDSVPVTLIFLVASPAEAAGEHLQVLARISRLLRTSGVVGSLRAAQTPLELLGVLRSAEASLAARW